MSQVSHKEFFDERSGKVELKNSGPARFQLDYLMIQIKAHVDESTVFFFNIAASVVCYIILFAIAPLVGTFYNMP